MTMPSRKRKAASAGPTPIEAIRHADKRVNIPTADNADFVDEKDREPKMLLYPRDPSLDPQLVWKGKDAQDAEELAITVPPLFIQEKIDPRVLVENLRRTAERREDEPELTLFDTFDGLTGMEPIEFYRHAANWSNRLVLGDSLEVMGSLAERENLRGQVQMIYMDPPYGIKFGSNWQVSTRRRDVKDGRLADATREVEQIKAFRDTWELGIHSYLSYLRDRLVAARDLLTESGSVFVQIGEDNVHLVRALLDEIFGPTQFVSMISFVTTSGFSQASQLGRAGDYLLWYAKDASRVKAKPLWYEAVDRQGYGWLVLSDGKMRGMTAAEKRGESQIPSGARIYTPDNIVSQGAASSPQPFKYLGKHYSPPTSSHWKASYPSGMERLALAGRLHVAKNSIRFVRYADDFGLKPYTNLWTDTATGNFTEDKIFVVQTSTKVVERCLLMTTDCGDLVLDPTCGSGTTATVAEQWGRRWITIDTSRVAVTLARQRLMGARYPHYVLSDSNDGQNREAQLTGQEPLTTATSNDVRKGFVCKRVPHITLKSIANNPDLVAGMSRDEVNASISRSAEIELLYDQPYEDAKTVRVAGPLTVESVSPHRALAADVPAPRSESGAADEASQQSFEKMLLENLQRSGVQNGRKAERFEFSSVELLGGRYLMAEAFPAEVGVVRQRVAVSIGPRYGTVGTDWIKSSAREAHRGDGFDVLLVLGFAFDPRALEVVEEFRDQSASVAFGVQHEIGAGGLRILLVRMNADLAMGEGLLKKSKAANLFTVFGEPDVGDPIWTDEGWTVEVRGFDVYNPISGEIRSGTADDIAMWMIDTDYNEESFFVRHCYFPGRDDPFKRLKVALKADIDEEAWATLNSTTSRPFPHPSTGKIAIKVINDYGDEVLRVLDLPQVGQKQ
jgi:adenine-specific DNA-methyltransferase